METAMYALASDVENLRGLVSFLAGVVTVQVCAICWLIVRR
jgi:hypothetical protein